jgi:hypothetical protein
MGVMGPIYGCLAQWLVQHEFCTSEHVQVTQALLRRRCCSVAHSRHAGLHACSAVLLYRLLLLVSLLSLSLHLCSDAYVAWDRGTSSCQKSVTVNLTMCCMDSSMRAQYVCCIPRDQCTGFHLGAGKVRQVEYGTPTACC